jgi:predicted amidohydrolase
MDRIRVATLQYLIRPVKAFGEFEEQVTGLVDTAKDYNCHLMVFPEYFTLQLLTLNDVRRPIADQVRHLAEELPRFQELMSGLARWSSPTGD